MNIYIYIYMLSLLCFVVDSMEKIQTTLHTFRNTRSKHDLHAPNSNRMVAKKVHTIQKLTSLTVFQTTVGILDMIQESSSLHLKCNTRLIPILKRNLCKLKFTGKVYMSGFLIIFLCLKQFLYVNFAKLEMGEIPV